jgi:D-alanine--poly(phosphoribitol) ligase subunit 1
VYLYNLALHFKEVASRHGERVALRFGPSEAMTYRELDGAAASVATALVGRFALGLGDVACIFGEKTAATYAAILACTRAGVPYVVLDPDSPLDRLSRILGTCQPRLILGPPASLDAVRPAEHAGGAHLADPESLLATPKDAAALEERARAISGETPAYVMYTSGSTGIPKGAVMTHANVLNLVAWARTTYSVVPDDVFTNANALYFDNAVFDLYSSLFNGASLVPITKAETRDPAALVAKVNALRCTVWFSVPTLLVYLQTCRALDGRNFRSVTRFIFGGEGYPKAKLKQLFDRYSDTAQLHNVYGPTECTCICSSYLLSSADFENLEGLPALGELAPNFQGLLLDEEGRPVPAGETGELCLLGPNVGKGYYNDPERTAKAFRQNPLNTRFREIMYATGDLARRDPADGKLYIQGRRDNQIKHMGYRIELDEIETALHRLDYVAHAAVFHHVANGLSRLVAVAALKGAATEDQLRGDLRALVPEYMMPSAVHFVPELPKNANGKVDRRQLIEQFAAR